MHILGYVSLLVLVGCASGKKERPNTDLGNVELTDLHSQPIDLKEYEGKTVFLNVWATWCKPCIQEMPAIANAQEKLKGEEIVFLLASNEGRDQIEKFISKHNYDFHFVLLENMEALHVQAMPTTFIYNAKGELKFSEAGARTWDNPENLDLISKIINDDEK